MSGLSLGRSKNISNDKATTFTQSAPVQTHVAPPVKEEPKEIETGEITASETVEVQVEHQVENEKYPWRKHHADTPVDVLWGVKEKKTIEIPQELALRLTYLKNEKKPKKYGDKVTEISCIIEALDDYTTKELKKLGHSVK